LVELRGFGGLRPRYQIGVWFESSVPRLPEGIETGGNQQEEEYVGKSDGCDVTPFKPLPNIQDCKPSSAHPNATTAAQRVTR
jgi:hypothetical protein